MQSIELKDEYETDSYAWYMHNAAFLRERKFSELDVDHLAEEVEDMGESIKRELLSRLAVLLAHLLKWKYQPNSQGHSWKYTIKEQRHQLRRLLKKNPSLKHDISYKLEEAYEDAILKAARETGFEEDHFPEKCPFTFQETLDDNFYPLS